MSSLYEIKQPLATIIEHFQYELKDIHRQIELTKAATYFVVTHDDTSYEPLGFGNRNPEWVPEFELVRDAVLAALRLRLEKTRAALNEAVERSIALDAEYGEPVPPPRSSRPAWQQQREVA